MTDAATTTTAPSPADAAAAATAAADQAATDAAAADAAAASTDADTDAAAMGSEPTAAQIAKWGSPEAAKEVQRLTRKLGDDRMTSKANAAAEATQKTLDAVAVALGIKTTDKAPATLESVTAQLTEAGGTITETTTQLDTARKSLALTQAAWAEGVNPEKMDYLEFKLGKDAEFQKIDATKPGYEGKVKAAIAALTAADSTLKLAGQVQKSGAESFSGASGDDAITKSGFGAMSMQARTALKQSNPAAYARLVAEQ
jgi:hypothetical protein